MITAAAHPHSFEQISGAIYGLDGFEWIPGGNGLHRLNSNTQLILDYTHHTFLVFLFLSSDTMMTVAFFVDALISD